MAEPGSPPAFMPSPRPQQYRMGVQQQQQQPGPRTFQFQQHPDMPPQGGGNYSQHGNYYYGGGPPPQRGGFRGGRQGGPAVRGGFSANTQDVRVEASPSGAFDGGGGPNMDRSPRGRMFMPPRAPVTSYAGPQYPQPPMGMALVPLPAGMLGSGYSPLGAMIPLSMSSFDLSSSGAAGQQGTGAMREGMGVPPGMPPAYVALPQSHAYGMLPQPAPPEYMAGYDGLSSASPLSRSDGTFYHPHHGGLPSSGNNDAGLYYNHGGMPSSGSGLGTVSVSSSSGSLSNSGMSVGSPGGHFAAPMMASPPPHHFFQGGRAGAVMVMLSPEQQQQHMLMQQQQLHYHMQQLQHMHMQSQQQQQQQQLGATGQVRAPMVAAVAASATHSEQTKQATAVTAASPHQPPQALLSSSSSNERQSLSLDTTTGDAVSTANGENPGPLTTDDGVAPPALSSVTLTTVPLDPLAARSSDPVHTDTTRGGEPVGTHRDNNARDAVTGPVAITYGSSAETDISGSVVPSEATAAAVPAPVATHIGFTVIAVSEWGAVATSELLPSTPAPTASITSSSSSEATAAPIVKAAPPPPPPPPRLVRFDATPVNAGPLQSLPAATSVAPAAAATVSASVPFPLVITLEVEDHEPGTSYRLYAREVHGTAAVRVPESVDELMAAPSSPWVTTSASAAGAEISAVAAAAAAAASPGEGAWKRASGALHLLHDFGVFDEPGALTLVCVTDAQTRTGKRYDAVLLAQPPPRPSPSSSSTPITGAEGEGAAAIDDQQRLQGPVVIVPVGLCAPLALTPATPPGQPPPPAQARRGKNMLKLRCAPPVDDGGAPVVEWELQIHVRGPDAADAAGGVGEGSNVEQQHKQQWGWKRVYRGADKLFEHKGLAPGGTYTYRAVALNSAGASAPSAPVTLSTDASVPAPPGAVSIESATPLAVSLVWDAPPRDNGAKVVEYHLEAAVGSPAALAAIAAAAVAAAATCTSAGGPDAAAAVCDDDSPAGSSPAAAPSTLKGPTAPSSSSSLGLAWETIYRGPDAAFTLTVATSKASTDGGGVGGSSWLAPNRTLVFRVYAKNSVGASLCSALSHVIVPAAPPNVPTGLHLLSAVSTGGDRAETATLVSSPSGTRGDTGGGSAAAAAAASTSKTSGTGAASASKAKASQLSVPPAAAAPLVPVTPSDDIRLAWSAATVAGCSSSSSVPHAAAATSAVSPASRVGSDKTGSAANSKKGAATVASGGGGAPAGGDVASSVAAAATQAAASPVIYVLQVAAEALHLAGDGTSTTPNASTYASATAAAAVFVPASAPVTVEVGPGTTYALPLKLTPGSSFAARVSARNAAGASPWSPWFVFWTAASTPAPVLVADAEALAVAPTVPLATPLNLVSGSSSSGGVGGSFVGSSGGGGVTMNHGRQQQRRVSSSSSDLARPRPVYSVKHGLRIRACVPAHHGPPLTGYAVSLRHVGPPLVPYADADTTSSSGGGAPRLVARRTAGHPAAASSPPLLLDEGGGGQQQQAPIVLVAPTRAALALLEAATAASASASLGPVPPASPSSAAAAAASAAAAANSAPSLAVGESVDVVYSVDGLRYAGVVDAVEHSSGDSGADTTQVDVTIIAFGLRVRVPLGSVRAQLRLGRRVRVSQSGGPVTDEMAAGRGSALLPAVVEGYTDDGYRVRLLQRQKQQQGQQRPAKLSPWAAAGAASRPSASGCGDKDVGGGNSDGAGDVLLDLPSASVLEDEEEQQQQQQQQRGSDTGTAAPALTSGGTGGGSGGGAPQRTKQATPAPFTSAVTITALNASTPSTATTAALPTAAAAVPVSAPPESYSDTLTMHDGSWRTLCTIPVAALDPPTVIALPRPGSGSSTASASGGAAAASTAAAAAACVTLEVADSLLPGHSYEVRVAAINALGRGEWGPVWPYTVTAPSGPVPVAPLLSLQQSSSSGTHPLTVSISLPPTSDTGGPVDGTHEEGGPMQWAVEIADAEVDVADAAATTAPVGSAVSEGHAAAVPPFSPTPAGTAATAVVSSRPVTFRRIHCGPLSSSSSSSTSSDTPTRSGTSLTWHLPLSSSACLSPGRAYFLRAAAWRNAEHGLGPWSAPLRVRAPPGPPAPPLEAPSVYWTSAAAAAMVMPASSSLPSTAGPEYDATDSTATVGAAPPSSSSFPVSSSGSGGVAPSVSPFALHALSAPLRSSPAVGAALAVAATSTFHGSASRPLDANRALLIASVNWPAPKSDSGCRLLGYEAALTRITRAGGGGGGGSGEGSSNFNFVHGEHGEGGSALRNSGKGRGSSVNIHASSVSGDLSDIAAAATGLVGVDDDDTGTYATTASLARPSIPISSSTTQVEVSRPSIPSTSSSMASTASVSVVSSEEEGDAAAGDAGPIGLVYCRPVGTLTSLTPPQQQRLAFAVHRLSHAPHFSAVIATAASGSARSKAPSSSSPSGTYTSASTASANRGRGGGGSGGAIVVYAGPWPCVLLGSLVPGATYSLRVRTVGEAWTDASSDGTGRAVSGDTAIATPSTSLYSEWGPPAVFRVPVDVPCAMPRPVLLSAGQTSLRLGFGRPLDGSAAAGGGVITGYEVQRVRMDTGHWCEQLMKEGSAAIAAAAVAVSGGDSAATSTSPSRQHQQLQLLVRSVSALLADTSLPFAASAAASTLSQYLSIDAALPSAALEEAENEAEAVAAGRRVVVSAPAGSGVKFGKLSPGSLVAARVAASSAAGTGEFGPWAVFSTLPPLPASPSPTSDTSDTAGDLAANAEHSRHPPSASSTPPQQLRHRGGGEGGARGYAALASAAPHTGTTANATATDAPSPSAAAAAAAARSGEVNNAAAAAAIVTSHPIADAKEAARAATKAAAKLKRRPKHSKWLPHAIGAAVVVLLIILVSVYFPGLLRGEATAVKRHTHG